MGNSVVTGIVFYCAAAMSLALFAFKARVWLGPVARGGVWGWVLLAVVLGAGCWARFGGGGLGFKTYYEEYELYNSARMVMNGRGPVVCMGGTLSRCEVTGESIYPPGLPLLEAAAMRGSRDVSPAAVFGMNCALGACVVLFVFVCGSLMCGGVRAGLFAGLFAAFSPLGVVLAKGGGMETAGMFFVCLFFALLAMYREGGGAVCAAGMFFACAAGVLVTPQYAFLGLFGGAVIGFGRPVRGAGLAAGAAVCCAVVVLLADKHSAGIAAGVQGAGFVPLLKHNIMMFNNAGFYPVAGLAAAAGGALLMFRGARGARPLGLFAVVFVAVASLYGMNFANGDFVRYSFPLVLPLCVFGGAGVDWVCGRMKGPVGRNAFIIAVGALAYVSLTSRAGIPLNDYMQEQDAFVGEALKKAPAGCSVYATNPSLVMVKTEGLRAYGLDELKKAGGRGDECKFLVWDAFCASGMAKECEAAAAGYERKAVASEDVLGLYKASLDRLMPRGGGEGR